MDKGHLLTDNILEDLEKELKSIYFKVFKDSKKELKKVQSIIKKYKDDMTEQQRLRLWNEEKRLDKIIMMMTIEVADANKIAIAMLNDELLNIYDLNYSWSAYKVETLSGYEVYANLYNKNAVKKILADKVNPFTKIALDEFKDRKVIEKFLKREFTTAIIKGESIDKIAERVKKVTQKSYNDSVRISQTETTRIESLGRQDAFKKGEEMGLKLNKRWNSTNDSRTRESHLLMQGETVGLDEKFSNGLEYPGALGGKASEVIRCRCSHTVEFVGVEKSAKLQELEAEVKKASYEEWKKRFSNGKDVKKEVEKEVGKIAKNKFGAEIKYNLKDSKNNEKVKETIDKLASEYNTRLISVGAGGKTSKGEKGHVKIDFSMNLSTSKIDTVVHEFAHSLTMTSTEKLGLTNDTEFWKETKKLYREYKKAIQKDATLEISNYSLEDVGEFMAEAFAHSYLKGTKELDWSFGNNFTYSDKMKAIIDKYFKKEV